MPRFFIALVALLAGCFDSSSDTTLSPCEQMVETLCARSCECAESECYHFLGAWSVGHTSQAACDAAERELWCQDSGSELDFAACEQALADAPCGQDYELSGLELPTACEAMVGY
jgi:hypothetical protein